MLILYLKIQYGISQIWCYQIYLVISMMCQLLACLRPPGQSEVPANKLTNPKPQCQEPSNREYHGGHFDHHFDFHFCFCFDQISQSTSWATLWILFVFISVSPRLNLAGLQPFKYVSKELSIIYTDSNPDTNGKWEKCKCEIQVTRFVFNISSPHNQYYVPITCFIPNLSRLTWWMLAACLMLIGSFFEYFQSGWWVVASHRQPIIFSSDITSYYNH